MTLIEALNTTRPFKRRGWSQYINAWAIDSSDNRGFNPGNFKFEEGGSINLYREDIIATDWMIKEAAITITKSEFFDGIKETIREEMAERKIIYSDDRTFDFLLNDALHRYWRNISGEKV